MSEIVKTQEGYKFEYPVVSIYDGKANHFAVRTGVLLTMDDGSEWFHSYGGHAPVKIKESES